MTTKLKSFRKRNF